MKKPQIIAISVAGGAALLAAYFATSFMPEPQAPIVQTQEVDSIPVLVAAADIAVGQIVNEGSFRWISWPREAASHGYITNENGAGEKRKRELAGSVARFALLNGEPITSQKLIKAGQGGVLAAILPGGMRAISTKIDPKTAAGSLILPNDHVDVVPQRAHHRHWSADRDQGRQESSRRRGHHRDPRVDAAAGRDDGPRKCDG